MISARGLAKRFGERTAVEHVSFEVAAGEVFGLLGPNGGGKTTTMRMLAGLLAPSEGEARIDGHDLYVDADARALLGFLTESPGLYDRLSAADNLAYFARLYDVPEREVDARVREALSMFGLADRAKDLAGSFSKGMRQRLALARSVLHRPRALLLDEPTSGLDPESAAEVREVIVDTAKHGIAVIVSTHNLAEAERLCRRVAVVKNKLLALVEDTRTHATRVSIRAEGVTTQIIEEIGRITTTVISDSQLVVADAEKVPDVVALLVQRGARVFEVVPNRRGLEETYLSLVGAQVSDHLGAVG